MKNIKAKAVGFVGGDLNRVPNHGHLLGWIWYGGDGLASHINGQGYTGGNGRRVGDADETGWQ